MTQAKRLRLAASMLVVLSVATGSVTVPPTVTATTIQSPPYADIFGGQWSDLDTTYASGYFYDYMDTGYHRFLNNSPTAAIAMGPSYAQSDAMWIAIGHGNGGFITFCSPPNGPACSTSLQATAALGACTATVMCLDHYSTTITRLRFMAFIGCDTANSGAGGANLLNTAIYTDGVSIALGFTDSIYFGFPSDGGEWYTQYLASNMALGQTVLQAHNNAVQVVRNNNLGFAYGYDGFILKNGQYKTHPAAYGS